MKFCFVRVVGWFAESGTAFFRDMMHVFGLYKQRVSGFRQAFKFVLSVSKTKPVFMQIGIGKGVNNCATG